jgi:hypothetical protein
MFAQSVSYLLQLIRQRGLPNRIFLQGNLEEAVSPEAVTICDRLSELIKICDEFSFD